MSCRVLVVDVNASEGSRTSRIALAAERLEGVEQVDFDSQQSHPGLATGEAEFLGPVARTTAGTVQLVYPERLPGWRTDTHGER